MSRWTDEILDEFAGHVRYEVNMLVGQVGWLADTYGCEIPDDGFEGPQEDAALEASLLHLRLLDDFLRNRGDEDNAIKAKDWVKNWPGRPESRWLDPRVRARINWQVAHLSGLREWRAGWKPCEYGLACCEELVRFFDEVRKSCPRERLDAFGDAPERASDGAAKFAAYVT